jgi:hypothetical protein
MLSIPDEINSYYYAKKEEIYRITFNKKGDYAKVYRSDSIYDMWHHTKWKWEVYKKDILSYSLTPKTIISFNYKDNEPIRLIVFAKYDHPSTGNTLISGINLNKLTEKEIQEIIDNYDTIFNEDTVNMIIMECNLLIPDVFRKGYRTFDEKYVKNLQQEL